MNYLHISKSIYYKYNITSKEPDKANNLRASKGYNNQKACKV